MDSKSKMRHIYVDPTYKAFNGNQLFDLSNANLNRDDQLLPFVRLKQFALSNGISIDTADLLNHQHTSCEGAEYYSLGLEPDYALMKSAGVRLSGFVLMEPPVVAPEMYELLPRLTRDFEHVYVHNTEGDGYSVGGVSIEKLRKFYWPMPHRGVLRTYWDNTERKNKVVVINGHHKPNSKTHELYSRRIEAIAAFSKTDDVDLYGRGWDNWKTRSSFWMPYLLNRRRLLKVWHGPVDSKYATLSNYHFCLCLENMEMKGYLTEKIFDCFYSGTIPLYLGAPDIDNYVPKEAYVDVRSFSTWVSLLEYLKGLQPGEVKRMKQAGREFMEGEKFLPYYHSFENLMVENGRR